MPTSCSHRFFSFHDFHTLFLGGLYGTAYVKGFIDSLSGKFLGILSTIGGMLPAVGIGMMLLAIYKGELASSSFSVSLRPRI